MDPVRVRFAPSPTGALHIGGLRTALYNYLLARQTGGQFILRIEDTDQKRYVPGAEGYIQEALEWSGLQADESPTSGGPHGPYRQSERRELYQSHVDMLLENKQAYYAFDTPEELEAAREAANGTFKYDAATRGKMRNSMSLSASEVEKLRADGVPSVVRLLVEPGQSVHIKDVVRGDVTFSTDELDDKVLMKADCLPTYHLANVVDDHDMQITHVIRGEEWLSSTAHHVLLYQAFGWESDMPVFAHLPLILKPTGKGKLSKRDGQKLGIPVFPLSWESEKAEERLEGFRERGFHPQALLNFLAFLGWNPGTEQEIFSLEGLVKAFSLEQVGKSGARFDFDKAQWFNQQYISEQAAEELVPHIERALSPLADHETEDRLLQMAELYKSRIRTYPEFRDQLLYLFETPTGYDEKTIRKKWKPSVAAVFQELIDAYRNQNDWSPDAIKAATMAFMEKHELGFGNVLPHLRNGIAGTGNGPGAFDMLSLLGQSESVSRLETAIKAWNSNT
ncbi:MAG: glutamate--tRNA ligase [Bacteroidota bacterium]